MLNLCLHKHFSRDHTTVLLRYRLCMRLDFLHVTKHSWISHWYAYFDASLNNGLRGKNLYIFSIYSLCIAIYARTGVECDLHRYWIMTIHLNKHHCKTEIGVRICVIVNWDTNFFYVYHCSLTNFHYNKAEKCICILLYPGRLLFMIFCIWLPFTGYRSFF